MDKRKSTHLHILASPSERESYMKAAGAEGMGLSQWVRWILNKAAAKAGVTKSGT